MAVFGADNRVLSVDPQVPTIDRVAGLVDAFESRDRRPVSKIIPLKGSFNNEHIVVVLHYRVIYRSPLDRGKLSLQYRFEIWRSNCCRDRLNSGEHLRFMFGKCIQNRLGFPDKNSSVPIEGSRFQKSFRCFNIRFFTKPLNRIGCKFCSVN